MKKIDYLFENKMSLIIHSEVNMNYIFLMYILINYNYKFLLSSTMYKMKMHTYIKFYFQYFILK